MPVHSTQSNIDASRPTGNCHRMSYMPDCQIAGLGNCFPFGSTVCSPTLGIIRRRYRMFGPGDWQNAIARLYSPHKHAFFLGLGSCIFSVEWLNHGELLASD